METQADRALAGHRLLGVAEEELHRLVLDVHDGPVQYLFAAVSQLAVLRARLGATPGSAPLVLYADRTKALVQAALDDIRRTIGALHSPAFLQRGIASTLEELAVEHEARTGGTVDFAVEGDVPVVAQATAIALYRILQEALANVQRHAGVGAACVRLRAADGHVQLEVSDRGRGFEPPPLVGPLATEAPAHIGLRGMRERAALVNGELRVESRPGVGTRVTVEVPVDG